MQIFQQLKSAQSAKCAGIKKTERNLSEFNFYQIPISFNSKEIRRGFLFFVKFYKLLVYKFGGLIIFYTFAKYLKQNKTLCTKELSH